jgi:hypothetical protein
MDVNLGMSARRASRVPSGSLAKASSDGAKIVNLSPLRVSTKPQAVTAATRVYDYIYIYILTYIYIYIYIDDTNI